MYKKIGYQTLLVLGVMLLSIVMLSSLTSTTPALISMKDFFQNSLLSFFIGRFVSIVIIFFSWSFLIKKAEGKNKSIKEHYNEVLQLRWFILAIFFLIELLNYWSR